MDFSQSFLPMTGGVRHHAWGSRARHDAPPYIAGLLRRPHGELPWAELWLGAHPNLPSAVTLRSGAQLSLNELAGLFPRKILGERCLRHGFRTLPFLLKILSCEKPLSIQSHPDKETAARLHRRNPGCYPDSNHKPETIVALTPFEALAGFRTLAEIFRDLEKHPSCGPWLQGAADLESLKSLCRALFALSDAGAAGVLAGLAGERPVCDADFLFRRLRQSHPGDRGALFAYLLQHFTLKPFQSLFLPPNLPHAYIRGSGIECMANSDNVIRAGLTAKTIDAAALLQTADFTAQGAMRPRDGERIAPGQLLYAPPAPEYRILAIADGTFAFQASPEDTLPGILLVLEGEFLIRAAGGDAVSAGQGTAWLKAAELLSGSVVPEGARSLAVWCAPNL